MPQYSAAIPAWSNSTSTRGSCKEMRFPCQSSCHIETLDPNEENLLKKFSIGRIFTMQLLSQPLNFALKGKLSYL